MPKKGRNIVIMQAFTNDEFDEFVRVNGDLDGEAKVFVQVAGEDADLRTVSDCQKWLDGRDLPSGDYHALRPLDEFVGEKPSGLQVTRKQKD